MKEGCARRNQAPFINKEIHEAFMTCTHPSKFGKRDSNENSKTYKKQRNCCVKLLQSTKKNFCNKLNVKKITDIVHELIPFFGSPLGTKHNIDFW